jgi:hypothetical protein
MEIARHHAIDHRMPGANVSANASGTCHHQITLPGRLRPEIAAHMSVDSDATAENQLTIDMTSARDQRIDASQSP